VLLGLAACSSSSPATGTSASGSGCQPAKGKVTLTYWSWIPGVSAAVNKFNATHPNIHVKLQMITGGPPAYQNYFNALKAGTQPDLGMVEFDMLPTMRFQHGLTNIADCAPVANLSKQVLPWTYSQVTLGSKDIFATPTDTAPLALFYRKDIFKKYGLAVPKTWAQYKADGEKLRRDNPSIYLTSFAPQDDLMLIGLDWQAGAQPFAFTGSSVTYDANSAGMNKVSNYWQSLVDDKLVNTSIQPLTPAQYAAWNDGSLATLIGATWDAGIMQSSAAKAKGKWAIAPLPQWTPGAAASGNYGGATTAVMAGTKYPYEDAVFADWMSTNLTATKIIFAGGGVAANLAYDQTGIIQQPQPYFGNQPVFEVFKQAGNNIDHAFQWSPNQTEFDNNLADDLAGAFHGTSTIAKAFAQAQQSAASDLKAQGISVVVK
jgi:multiple sugar transport system substrate-binding protein